MPRLGEGWSLRQSRRSLTLATFSLQLEEVGQLEYFHFFLLLLYHSLYHRTHCSGINEKRKCTVKLIFTEKYLKPLTFAINWEFKDFRYDIPIYVNHIQLVPAMQKTSYFCLSVLPFLSHHYVLPVFLPLHPYNGLR